MVRPRLRKVRARLNQLLERSWDWWRRKPFFVLLIAAALPFVVEQLAPDFVAMVTRALGFDRVTTLLLLVAGLALLAMMSWAVHLATRPKDPLPVGLIHADYERLTFLDERGVRRVQAEIVDPCFPGVYPNEDEIFEMYRKNPVMGAAIHSHKSNSIVAFACAWPLKVRAAERLLAGKITENDLGADDILPAASNRRATHLLIPVVIVRNPGEKEGVEQNYAIRGAFRDLVCDVYYGDRPRPITFVATGFTEAGVNYCKQLRMEKVAEVMMERRKVPIYSRTLSREEFKRIF